MNSSLEHQIGALAQAELSHREAAEEHTRLAQKCREQRIRLIGQLDLLREMSPQTANPDGPQTAPASAPKSSPPEPPEIPPYNGHNPAEDFETTFPPRDTLAGPSPNHRDPSATPGDLSSEFTKNGV